MITGLEPRLIQTQPGPTWSDFIYPEKWSERSYGCLRTIQLTDNITMELTATFDGHFAYRFIKSYCPVGRYHLTNDALRQASETILVLSCLFAADHNCTTMVMWWPHRRFPTMNMKWKEFDKLITKEWMRRHGWKLTPIDIIDGDRWAERLTYVRN